MITAGHHKAVKVGGDAGETKSGAPQVAIAFRLVDTGEVITWYGYFTEKTEAMTVKTLALVGVKPDGSNLQDPNDTEVTLVIEEEQNDKGEMVMKVRWVNGGDGVAMQNRMDAGKRAALFNRIGGAILKAQAGAPTTSNAPKRTGAPAQRPPAPRQNAAPPEDDFGGDQEIPF